MEGLVEIQKWLHVWTEAERARRLGIKNPAPGRLTTVQGENPPKQVEEIDDDVEGDG